MNITLLTKNKEKLDNYKLNNIDEHFKKYGVDYFKVLELTNDIWSESTHFKYLERDFLNISKRLNEDLFKQVYDITKIFKIFRILDNEEEVRINSRIDEMLDLIDLSIMIAGIVMKEIDEFYYYLPIDLYNEMNNFSGMFNRYDNFEIFCSFIDGDFDCYAPEVKSE